MSDAHEQQSDVLRELAANRNALQPSGMFSWLLLGSSAITAFAPPPAASAVKRREDCVRVFSRVVAMLAAVTGKM